MILTVGYELDAAKRMLEDEGLDVAKTVEVSSRKGVDGNQARVVRQRALGDGSIELTYAIFKTDCEYVGANPNVTEGKLKFE